MLPFHNQIMIDKLLFPVGCKKSFWIFLIFWTRLSCRRRNLAAVELEVVPAPLAAAITARSGMLTISLGSGSDCDVQYLFSADLLGENRGHVPRHAKVYRNFAAEHDRLQEERRAAYREYIADVREGQFPAQGHSVAMEEGVLAEALKDEGYA